jgi:hypothetical protein
MIRGVDREIRRSIKEAAKAEGVSVGIWVRRSLVRALGANAASATNVTELNAHLEALGARVQALERSHRALQREFQHSERPGAEPTNERRSRWGRNRKSK